MTFNNKKNERLELRDGGCVWKSRSVAVATCVVRTNPDDDTKLQVLVVKRGASCTHPGLYCYPCGFLEWSETIPQAAIREIWEETGLTVDIKDLDFSDVDSNPKSYNQNVSIHFSTYYVGEEVPTTANAEYEEIESVAWVEFYEALKLNWAFDHKERLQNLIKGLGGEVFAEKD